MATIGSGSSEASLAVAGVGGSELGSRTLRALPRALTLRAGAVHRALALSVALAVVAPASASRAQEAEVASEAASAPNDPNDRSARARDAYLQGVEAFEAERYDEALERFEAAYELERLPGLLFNQASALDRLGRVDEAVVRYEAYLAALPEAANGAYVQSRLTLLRAELERNAAADASAEPSASAEPTPAPPEPAPTNARPLVGPLVTFGIALAAGAAAVGTGVRALGLRGTLDDACEDGECPPEEEGTARSMGRFARTTDVLLGVAGAAAITGVLWLLLGRAEDDDAPRVSAAFDRRGGEARVNWRF